MWSAELKGMMCVWDIRMGTRPAVSAVVTRRGVGSASLGVGPGGGGVVVLEGGHIVGGGPNGEHSLPAPPASAIDVITAFSCHAHAPICAVGTGDRGVVLLDSALTSVGALKYDEGFTGARIAPTISLAWSPASMRLAQSDNEGSIHVYAPPGAGAAGPAEVPSGLGGFGGNESYTFSMAREAATRQRRGRAAASKSGYDEIGQRSPASGGSGARDGSPRRGSRSDSELFSMFGVMGTRTSRAASDGDGELPGVRGSRHRRRLDAMLAQDEEEGETNEGYLARAVAASAPRKARSGNKSGGLDLNASARRLRTAALRAGLTELPAEHQMAAQAVQVEARARRAAAQRLRQSSTTRRIRLASRRLDASARGIRSREYIYDGSSGSTDSDESDGMQAGSIPADAGGDDLVRDRATAHRALRLARSKARNAAIAREIAAPDRGASSLRGGLLVATPGGVDPRSKKPERMRVFSMRATDERASREE